LAANTDTGNRPSFASAAPPAIGRELFTYLQKRALEIYPTCQFGQFGADMQVALINNGPVTFTLRCLEK
jgi:D-tyrosyl-tRNA(Tyr) deacylase